MWWYLVHAPPRCLGSRVRVAYTFRIRLRFEAKERRNRAIPDIAQCCHHFFFFMESWDTRIFSPHLYFFSFSLFVFSPSRFIVNSTLLLALFFPLFLFSLIFLFFSLSLKDKSRRKSDPRPRFYNIAAYRWCRILKTRVGFCRVAFRRSCIIRSAPWKKVKGREGERKRFVLHQSLRETVSLLERKRSQRYRCTHILRTLFSHGLKNGTLTDVASATITIRFQQRRWIKFNVISVPLIVERG